MDIAARTRPDTVASPAAVTFDEQAFFAWCHAPSNRVPDETNAEAAAVDGNYNSYEADDHAGSLVERTLLALRTAPHVWRTAAGVGPVIAWCTADGEGRRRRGHHLSVDGVEVFAGAHPADDLVIRHTRTRRLCPYGRHGRRRPGAEHSHRRGHRGRRPVSHGDKRIHHVIAR